MLPTHPRITHIDGGFKIAEDPKEEEFKRLIFAKFPTLTASHNQRCFDMAFGFKLANSVIELFSVQIETEEDMGFFRMPGTDYIEEKFDKSLSAEEIANFVAERVGHYLPIFK